jgi:hypothetical protein
MLHKLGLGDGDELWMPAGGLGDGLATRAPGVLKVATRVVGDVRYISANTFPEARSQDLRSLTIHVSHHSDSSLHRRDGMRRDVVREKDDEERPRRVFV